ncbi:hypothetical protein [Geothrix sp. PMB-07]|uniref:hypothetical protein n=1 Tax=Geothrix sp. PMB-07 TaxID=3068640 RepID=UPI002741E064|nr:hypothetical protein [Geothrix sp. PMB-07]WLT33243.1 hypothetical protein Q9293_07885 [Geothrix sp. PMB-07]
MTLDSPSGFLRRRLYFALLCAPLAAQTPVLQDEAERLRQAFVHWGEGGSAPASAPLHQASAFTGAVALVAIAPGGTARTPLLDGGGLGTVLNGTGLAWQLGWSSGGFEVDTTFLAVHGSGDQADRLRLFQGRLGYRSERGWRFALERMPFQWGYGITGGYLFGTSARTFPRAVLETPAVDLSVFGVPLGNWGFEAFLGKLGADQQVPDWAADREQILAAARTQGGIVQKAFQGGYRLKARFGSSLEMNFAVSSQWGGIAADGRKVTDGYGFRDYLSSFLGSQNIGVSEASGDPGNPSGGPTKSQSNGIANVEMRFRPSWLAELAGAKGAFAYISRGAENVNWQWKDFLHHPLQAIWHDVKSDATTSPRTVWHKDRREASPNLQWPNEAVGLQFTWDHADLGIEYLDNRTGEVPGHGYQTYSHWFFLAGHSNGGDPMGDAFGGSIITRTVSWGWKQQGWSVRGIFTDGLRTFKDDLIAWKAAHPGFSPMPNHFQHAELQGTLAFAEKWSIGASLAFQREQKLHFEPGLNARGTNAVVAISRRF